MMNQAKIVVVGESGTGKTSFVNSLKGCEEFKLKVKINTYYSLLSHETF